MSRGFQRLATKLHLTVVGTAVLALGTLGLAAWPMLQSAIREDRVKLFVENYTRALAESVSHALVQYEQRVYAVAREVALEPGPPSAVVRQLNRAVAEPVPGATDGIFDLLVVVARDGAILAANTADRLGQPLPTAALVGRRIDEFPEERRAFAGALNGRGLHDQYRSAMVALVRPAPAGEDMAHQYAIAFAVAIPNSERVLLAVINWQAIQHILDRAEAPLAEVGFPSGYAFMFAKDCDRVIAHKFRDPQGLNNYDTHLTREHNLPGLSKAALLGELSYRYEYPAGVGKVSGLARIDDPEFGWTVGLGINDSDVVLPAITLLRWLAVLGASVLLLAILFSRYLSNRITSDLRELTQSAQRIAHGFFETRAVVRSRDEVGQLSSAFNTMTEALAARDEVIREQQERLIERTRLEREITIAAEVQQRLLPQVQPPVAALDYAGYCQPLRTVGGDCYDFLPLGVDRVGLLVADVSGKGISAALLMASLHACVRTHAPLVGDQCTDLVSRLNHLLFESTDPDRFATLFYGIFDGSRRQLTYANAGHLPPLVVRANGEPRRGREAMGAVIPGRQGTAAALAPETPPANGCSAWEWLYSGAPPVGLFRNIPAVQGILDLAPGDWLLVYSDGLVEASNLKDEEFGGQRLLDIVQQNFDCEASQMRDSILAAVDLHLQRKPAEDDVTLIAARVR